MSGLQVVLRYMRHLVGYLLMNSFASLSFLSHSRLPVRSLLFQCSVCAHGGHQACYRSYYMERPMVELPRSFPQVTAIRVRSVTRTSPLGSEGDDDDSSTTSEIPLESHSPVHDGQSGKLLGHPCAAGCGHFCWAVNGTQKKYETL